MPSDTRPLMQFGKKRLPYGNFIYLRRLPADATDESIAEWLARYMPITAAHVSVDVCGPDASALICIDKLATLHLLRRVFEGLQFPGMSVPVTFSPFGRPRTGPPSQQAEMTPPHVPDDVEVTEENWAAQI
jgi:hypothetical protein